MTLTYDNLFAYDTPEYTFDGTAITIAARLLIRAVLVGDVQFGWVNVEDRHLGTAFPTITDVLAHRDLIL